ncbi:MAG: 3-hydroxybutyryl-CoA dehydrogenase [Vicinamibacteria bacterium]|nr:3-hydroxybutyryl-CoA dehydrogenase [Vicinamibacteria bacterium]
MKTIAVIGSGTMGSGIAQVFAQAGYAVLLHDVQQAALDRARAGIEKSLARFVEKGTLSVADRDAALGRLRVSADIDDLAAADYVVEAIVESVDAKRALFQTLDAMTRPDVILASNTSSISITLIGAATSRPDKVLGMHFMNPVPLMTLVELIRGQSTSDASMMVATDLTTALGKVPVEANDYPGFIANRILMPMINEAFYALMEGVGAREAIDTVMKLGMNHPMGPLTLADFIGLDVCLAILEVLHHGLGDPKYRPCPLLRRMVDAGHLGRKSGQGVYTYDRT